ncbi:MAG: polysaccharide biosynthesis/export family protein [Planctomycetes bacterium]|nr:polysaccharide biosynthesis/export family protein [Planctomycetota bacterium]
MMSLVPRARLVLALLLAFCVACSTAPDKRILQNLNTAGFGKSYTGNAEEENYITIGDVLVITDTYQPEELSATERVEIDGTVLLPEIGAVNVAGMTRTEIESMLMDKYSPYYDLLDVHVRIQSSAGKFYFVYGEVSSEGKKILEGDLTLWEAVMEAVPDDETANLGRVRVIRPDPRDPLIMTFDVGQMIEAGDSTFNVKVRELDIIYVPPTMLAQVGYFINTLLFPVKMVLSGLSDAVRTLRDIETIGTNQRYFYNTNTTGVF